jgi:HPt (histidine-containing phosphotransfer) domain-containing protein
MIVDDARKDTVLDIAGTLSRFGGDESLFADMVRFVLDDAPPLYTKLRAAVETDDRAAIQMHAHALKGLIASCGGVRAANAAQRIESAVRSGAASETISLLESLGHELDQLEQALRAYRA